MKIWILKHGGDTEVFIKESDLNTRVEELYHLKMDMIANQFGAKKYTPKWLTVVDHNNNKGQSIKVRPRKGTTKYYKASLFAKENYDALKIEISSKEIDILD